MLTIATPEPARRAPLSPQIVRDAEAICAQVDPPCPDQGEIRAALAALFQSDAGSAPVVELRSLNTGKDGTVVGYYDDLDVLTTHAAALNRTSGTAYVVLNPLNRALLARSVNRYETRARHAARDTDVVRLSRLLVDTDPIRPAGIAADTDEHEAALARCQEIRALLTELGWPEPLIQADSGNGGHQIYALDLPNTADNVELLKQVLEALAYLFNDARVEVDRTTYNPARLTKLYGTVARKGDHTVDRPHRVARILQAHDEPSPVSREQLSTVAAMRPQNAKQTRLKDHGLPEPVAFGSFDIEAWLREYDVPVARVGTWNGGRKWILNTCAFNPDHNNAAAFIVQLANGAIAAGCHHNGCAGKGWSDFRRLIESARPDVQGVLPSPTVTSSGAQTAVPRHTSQPTIVTASELLQRVFVPPKEVVPGILVEGAVILAGRPKMGKSRLVVSFAVAVASGGRALGQIAVDPGDVLYLALEDGERRVQDRLRAMVGNADLPQLQIATSWAQLDAGGLEDLDGWLRTHPQARLIIIDTLKRVRPAGRGTQRLYNEDYDAVAPLADLAKRYGVCILIVHHTRKSDADDVLDLISGSTGLTGAVDGGIVLRGSRGKAEAELVIVHRDLEDQELALIRDTTLGSWRLVGAADEARLSGLRSAILGVLRASPDPLRSSEVAKAVATNDGAVRTALSRMVDAGQILRVEGGYRAPP